MILLAALAGAAIVGGLVLGLAGLRGHVPVPGKPPGRRPGWPSRGRAASGR